MKNLNIGRLAIGFLLGVLLLTATACSHKNTSKFSNQPDFTNGIQKVGLLYSKSKQVKSTKSVNDFINPKMQQEILDPTQIPALKQPIIDRSNPKNQLLEKTKQMFKDASNF
jgi:hypothetical protein